MAYDFISSPHVEILKLAKENILLHSKLYLVQNANGIHAIIGSSNFTASGLGIYGDKSNKELNLLCDSKHDTGQALEYFKSIYKESTSCKDDVLNTLHTSFFYHSPKDIFSKIISPLPQAEPPTRTESQALQAAVEAFGLYEFQALASQELLARLKRYTIALLADPVGAGKTLSAIGVASTYALITIIAPKNLVAQWESYFSPNEHTPHADFIKELHGKVLVFSYHQAQNPNEFERSRLKISTLIIIDESHNFRNGLPHTRQQKPNNYQKLRANLNANAHLLLLSATPINNNFLDLANQLCLKGESFYDPIATYRIYPQDICQKAQKALESAYRGDYEELPPIELEKDYFELTHLIFSRSSEQIMSYLKVLNKNMPKQHLKTYELSSIPKHIDFSFKELSSYLGLNEQDPQNYISFAIYDPSKFLPEGIADRLFSKQLANLGDYTTPRGFICMNLTKALESSLDAFLPTIAKIIAYHRTYLKEAALLEKNKANPNAQDSNHLNNALNNESLEDLEILNEEEGESDGDEGNLLPTRLAKLKAEGYLHTLDKKFKERVELDLALLSRIEAKLKGYNSQKDFQTSQKYQKLREIIDAIPHIKSQKCLIFSESIPTTEAIKNALRRDYPKLNIESINGELNSKDFISYKNRFSPRSLKYELKDNENEIDILISSDCLSEGANLQDCKHLINWDISFNPVRSIQRIGRIWRIGSLHTSNHITHFFPDISIDSYIQLESKLKFKILAAQSATAIMDPHSIKLEKERKAFEEKRKKAYEALKTQNIALEETRLNYFLTLESVLGGLAHSLKLPQTPLNNGIFSIAYAKTAPQHHLLAYMQELESKEYYCTLFDLSTGELKSSVNDRGASILESLSYLKDIEDKESSLFSPLEDLTNNFTNLELLKAIFAKLTSKLNHQIQTHASHLAQAKKSDGGLFEVKNRHFKLIAWLFINPDFESMRTLSGQSTKIADSGSAHRSIMGAE
nr:helicase-related protein [Helicobacter marmotae]